MDEKERRLEVILDILSVAEKVRRLKTTNPRRMERREIAWDLLEPVYSRWHKSDVLIGSPEERYLNGLVNEYGPNANHLYDNLIIDLTLSVRAQNGLEMAGVKYVGQLVQYTELEVLKFENIGMKTLREIKNVLSEIECSLGMDLNYVPPKERTKNRIILF